MLPKFEAPYAYGRITTKPTLPDWAIPVKACEDCSKPVVSIVKNGQAYTAGFIISRGKDKYGKVMCADCQSEKAGKK